jgi:hypothetical protein
MIQHQWFAALVIIKAAQGIISNRRRLEHLCGYDEDYGGDKMLLKRINEFLDDTHIEHEVKDALDFATTLNKKT